MSSTTKLCEDFNKRETDFDVLSPSLQNSIKKIIEKENFIQYDVVIKDLNTRGDNYLGTLYEIDIKGITAESEKEINLFVKEKLIWKNITLLKSEQLFANEEFIYKELSNIFTSLQDQANVPLKERFKIAKAYAETNNNAIILENLCKKGYVRNEKTGSTSLKYYQLGVQELAKLHALSFAIENKMPEYFKEKIAVIENPFNFNEDWFELMRKVCRYLANLYDDETKTKIENFVPVLIEKIGKYQNDKTNICTISHGDYKKNNCMVCMKDGEPEELIIIDYQIMDYGCPIRDLLLFIIYGSDKEFRRNHMNDLKNLYFETLSSFLKYFDMNVETVFPRKEFERIYIEWMDFGLIMYLYFTVFMITSDSGLDMQNLTLRELPYHPDKANEKIIREMIDDFVKWGYL